MVDGGIFFCYCKLDRRILVFIAKNGKIKKSKLLKLDNLGKVGYGTCTNNTKVNEIFGLIPLVAAPK